MYVRAFNRRHGFDGSLFSSRFKSVLIESDEQLATEVRYVHRNPLDLGADIRTYPWSSYRTYLEPAARSRDFDPAIKVPDNNESRSDLQRFTETDLASDKTAIDDGTSDFKVDDHCPVAALIDATVHAVSLVSGAPPESVRSSRPDDEGDPKLVALLLAYEHLPASALVETWGFSSESALRSAVLRARNRSRRYLPFRNLLAQAHRKVGAEPLKVLPLAS